MFGRWLLRAVATVAVLYTLRLVWVVEMQDDDPAPLPEATRPEVKREDSWYPDLEKLRAARPPAVEKTGGGGYDGPIPSWRAVEIELPGVRDKHGDPVKVIRMVPGGRSEPTERPIPPAE